MHRQPPMIPTSATPELIIGRDNMSIFKKHYQICLSSTNQGEFPDKRLDKEIGVSDRPEIARVLKELRDNGFYPDGFYNGEIVWRTVIKSKQQILFELGLDKYIGKTIQELSKIVKQFKYSSTNTVFND